MVHLINTHVQLSADVSLNLALRFPLSQYSAYDSHERFCETVCLRMVVWALAAHKYNK